MTDTGRPVTRAEALAVARRALVEAEARRDATTRDAFISEIIEYIGGISIMIDALSQRTADTSACNRANDLCMELFELVTSMRDKGDTK